MGRPIPAHIPDEWCETNCLSFPLYCEDELTTYAKKDTLPLSSRHLPRLRIAVRTPKTCLISKRQCHGVAHLPKISYLHLPKNKEKRHPVQATTLRALLVPLLGTSAAGSPTPRSNAQRGAFRSRSVLSCLRRVARRSARGSAGGSAACPSWCRRFCFWWQRSHTAGRGGRGRRA